MRCPSLHVIEGALGGALGRVSDVAVRTSDRAAWQENRNMRFDIDASLQVWVAVGF